MRPETIPASFERLRSMIQDLDGYIDRRAAELAKPLLGKALADVAEATERTRAEVRRREDLLAELRRRLDPLQRRSDENRTACERLAGALGHSPVGCSLPQLVDEAIEALAGKDTADGT
jgi:chromosome segregation ATPase